MKKILSFIIIWLSIFFFMENTFSKSVFANEGCTSSKKDPFCLWKVTELKVDQSLDTLVTNSTVYLLWFLYFVAVVYWMYWAYNILTAAWNDDKVDLGKKIILRAVLWIIVIFLASPIAQFLLWNWSKNSLAEQTRLAWQEEKIK